MVGQLYEPGDAPPRRGFSIFYMGINIGALLGPLVAGYLAQRVNWHIGFSAAGVGMTAGLIQYALGKHKLAGRRRSPRRAAWAPPATATSAAADIHATTGHGVSSPPTNGPGIGAIVVFFLFATLFWGAYEQAGSTLDAVRRPLHPAVALRLRVSSSWFQMVQPTASSCSRRYSPGSGSNSGSASPRVPAKFALGLVFVGLAFALLMPAASIAQSAGIRASPWWLITAYAITELGELCISPVGLSLVTKLAPLASSA